MKKDLYLKILNREDIYNDPIIAVGSICDDLSKLNETINKKFSCISENIERLANILIAFNEHVLILPLSEEK